MNHFALRTGLSWLFAFSTVLAGQALADEAQQVTRVLNEGELPQDARLQNLKDLDGYFPFTPPATREQWQQRADEVRQRILVAMGLHPMPERSPVKATMHGKVDREEYTVEKVCFESYPGFFVTGSLYRPQGKEGPFPAVLSPHGHFSNGRFHDHGLEEVRKQILDGAERFEIGGRHPIQARCVQLARMGCIVFQYDMIGYADSRQISSEVAHGHSDPRPHMEGRERWGLYSAQAEMRLQNVMGLQTFNSLRGVDFLVSLPDVDHTRIAVTGASGGGTQTMILSAIDPRVAVSFPAVMVSTAMQGGCTCENACCLRVGTGNVEFAGLFAPKPLAMSSANDWTVELGDKGLPQLMQLYDLYDAKDRVAGYLLRTHFGHNYNYVSRGKMYHWLNKHLSLGLNEPILEEDYQPVAIEELSVWDDAHPLPPSGDEFEFELLQSMSQASDRQLDALLPTDAGSLEQFRESVGGALRTVLCTSWDKVGSVERVKVSKEDQGEFWLFKDKLRTAEGSELPTLFLRPKQWKNEVVVWVSGHGKASLFTDTGQLRDEPRRLLSAGYSIASADLFQQGEFLDTDERLEQTRKVENNRDFAGYTFGYNRTLFADRVHDILTLLKFIVDDEHPTEHVHLIGVEAAAPHVVVAGGLAGDRVTKLAIDNADFRFAEITSWRDPDFLPGAVKYGDLPVMMGLCAPGRVWMATQTGNVPQQAVRIFGAAGGEIFVHASQDPTGDAVRWLLQ